MPRGGSAISSLGEGGAFMLKGACHCGAVQITLPRTITDCNCSICRRYGVLWAYYKSSSVGLKAQTADLASYSWGEKSIEFVRCAQCGCVVCWKPLGRTQADYRMGVNVRNFDPARLMGARLRRLDGASSWRFID
jgi:hypothetical protein